jgi:signal transduction histidine kinase
LVGADIQFELLKAECLWDIMIDPVQLDQIIMNLAVNARDAMPDGGAITIEITNVTLDESFLSAPFRKCGDYVRINFRDTGVGMDSETIDHVFEPFFTTKKVGKGTGLGLATIHNIVTHNHGFIDVTSAPQMGTLFSIFFPRYRVD